MVVIELSPLLGSCAAQGSAPCGSPEARAFDFWIGKWAIRQSILQADGTYLHFPATTSVTRALDGCALVEHWEGTVQFFWEGMNAPRAMKGLSVRSYDPQTEQWSIYWMDTRAARFESPYVGGFADGKGEFYREWETPEAKQIGRITFSGITPDSVQWSLAISRDGRQTWTTIWTMDMQRSKE